MSNMQCKQTTKKAQNHDTQIYTISRSRCQLTGNHEGGIFIDYFVIKICGFLKIHKQAGGKKLIISYVNYQNVKNPNMWC